MFALQQFIHLPLRQRAAFDQCRRHGLGIGQVHALGFQILPQLRQLLLRHQAASLHSIKKRGNKLGRHELGSSEPQRWETNATP